MHVLHRKRTRRVSDGWCGSLWRGLDGEEEGDLICCFLRLCAI